MASAGRASKDTVGALFYWRKTDRFETYMIGCSRRTLGQCQNKRASLGIKDARRRAITVLQIRLSASGGDFGRCAASSGRLDFFAIGLLSGLANVNAAFEERAIFNGDAGCNYVSGE